MMLENRLGHIFVSTFRIKQKTVLVHFTAFTVQFELGHTNLLSRIGVQEGFGFVLRTTCVKYSPRFGKGPL